MIKITVTLDDIDYESAIDALFPIIFKSKIASASSKGVAKTVIKNKTPEQIDEILASFINKHDDKITEFLQNKLTSLNVCAKIRGISADNK